MSVLVDIEGMTNLLSQFAPTVRKVKCIERGDLLIVLPAQPPEKEIFGYGKPVNMQLWQRFPMPEELSRIKSMDEWGEMPREFQTKVFSVYRGGVSP